MKNDLPARPRGRPRKTPVDGERPPVSVRFSPRTRQQLERAADINGWSLSQEIDARVAQSFAEEAMVGTHTAMLFRSLAGIAWLIEQETGKSWREDYLTGRAVLAGVVRALSAALPDSPDGEVERLAVADVLDREMLDSIDPDTDAKAQQYKKAMDDAHELGLRIGGRAPKTIGQSRKNVR